MKLKSALEKCAPQFKGKSKEKRKDMAIAAYLSRNEDMDKLDEKIAGLVKKSKQTGVPYGILKKSYDRGMAAWRTGHRPGTTPQQWAFARVNSMLTGGKADPDLQAKIRAGGYKKKKKKSNEYEEALEQQNVVLPKVKETVETLKNNDIKVLISCLESGMDIWTEEERKILISKKRENQRSSKEKKDPMTLHEQRRIALFGE